MKNLLIVLAVVVFFASCKKEDDPKPDPDFAPDLVGTYIGTETQAGPAVGNVTFSDASKTMTITSLDKNKIQLSSFNGGTSMIFTLSDIGSGNVGLTPTASSMEKYGSTMDNSYNPSTRELRVYIKYTGSPSNPKFYFYQANKQ